MSRFLSQAWVEEFNAALAGMVFADIGPDASLATADGRFTVLEEVSGTPDGDVRLLLAVDGGTLRLLLQTGAEADGSDPDVTIALSYDDARALSTGELSPAEALNGGRIRVRGDLSVLVATQEMLGAARASTQVMDAATTY